MPYVVRLHNKYIPELPKKVFSYSHPKATLEGNNSYRQSKTLSWEMSKVCRIHGFAGYFHCCLYKDVTMSIHPQMHTPKMHRYLNQKGSTKFNFKYSASPDLWIFHFPKIRPQIGFCPQIGWKSTNRVSEGFHSYYVIKKTFKLQKTHKMSSCQNLYELIINEFKWNVKINRRNDKSSPLC